MPYVNRFLTNANGAITFTGNTFGLNKQANANAPGTAGSIGTFFSVNPSSVDGSFPTGTTANYLQNSSSAVLRLPSTTTQILYAELIWGGSYLYGGEDVSSALNNAVTFITPSRTVSVQSDTATRFTLTSSSFYYVRSANVTNLISQAGTYSVLGVPGTQSTTENNANAAGWTLAVVYADPLQKSRNLSIFVGAELTSSATGSSTAAVSGFGTPITGTVNGRLLVSAIEGDSAIVGDQLQFGPTTASLQPVSGPNNPINNFFASQINNDSGALDTSGQFGSLNSTPGGSLSGARQGWDITNIDVSARLSNNQTSAVVRGTTNGDTYVISALALQVDINAPVLNVSKSANVTSARTGDIITYTVQVSNIGTAAANVLIATDPLSSATTFIPNSLQVDGVTQTNADIRNGLPLGTLNINQTRVLTYQVRVVGPLTSISSLGNQVFINYQFESTPGNVLTGSGASPVNSVTAINTPPTVPNYTITNPEDTVAIGTVIGNDIDGNPLTYRIGTRPTNGIVTVNPNGQFVYTPNLNFNGTDQFTVIVDDGQGGTATSIVTIINTPVNDNPVTQNYAVITNEDTPLVGQIQATDVDGDSLTFQLQSSPTNGTVTITNSGSYVYTPNLNFNGTDQFTVLVSDGQGGTAVSTVTVTVTPVNDAPTVPNYTFSTQEDSPVVGAIVGTDVDGNPLSYQLQNRPTNGIAVVNANGTFSYQPNLNFNGSDQFTVLVSDGQGGTAVSTVTINVIPVNDPPITSNVSFTIAEDSTLINRVVAVDPDGDPLTFSLQAAPGNGVAVVNANGTFSYQPNLNFNGTDQFTVLVSDGQGGTAVSTVTVTVTPVNDAPTVPNYTFSTQEDSPVVGAVVGIDVDGNPLSYQLQVAPTNGVAAVNANGTFSYQPNLNFNGTDQFTVLVSDGQGGTAVSTVTINVIPVNDLPITSNVSFTIAEDSTLINQIVAVDPDGDPLTFSLQAAPGNGVAVVNANGTFSYQPNLNFNGTDQFTVLVSDGQGGTAVSTVTVIVTPVNDAPTVPNYTFSTQEDSPVVGAVVGIDVDGNPLSYQLQVAPTNGVAAVNANGTFSYQPNPNFNGTDQFTVLVSDGQGGTAVSTVTINVIPVNDPPITSNVSFTIAEDSTLINQIVAVDPDGDPLTFSLQAAPGNGVAVVNANGTFSYQPNLNFNGTDQFTVLVSDGQGGTAVSTVTVTVTPVNDAPTVPNYTFSTQEDSPVVGAVVGIDVDGNPLSYQLQVAPTNGVAAVNANGTFSYQPNPNFNGTDQFTVLVSDGQGGTAVSIVTINVIPVNDPPITSNVSFTIAEDSTLINQIVAVDPDGDPLTFSLQAAPGNGVAVVNANGTFSYQPNPNFNGTDQFMVLVSDGQGGTAVSTVTVIVTPVNDAPTVPNYTFSTQEDSPVVGAVVGIDVDGNPLSYQLQVAPTNGVAAVNANGTFSYQPNPNFNGTDQFTVLVSDGQGGTAVSIVTINVIPVNDPPITSNVSFTIAEDSTLINQIVAVDPDGDPLTFSLQAAPGNGVAVVNADGTFSYQPNANFNGTDQFTVLVSDGQGGTAVSTVTVIVTPVNDAPTVPNYTFSTQEDSPVVGVVVGIDVDGNPLSYQLQVAPTNGVAVVNANGTFSYQPNLNFNGSDQFTVLVSDGQGGTAVSTVTINVIPVNDAPITSNVSFTIAEDSTLINQIVAVDPDGDPLTFSLQAAPGNGVAVVNADGTFSYQPNANFNGTDQFTVLVSDGQGGTAVSTVTVIVTPVNDAPTVPNYTFSTQEDSPVVGAIVGTDVDGNPLSYQLQNPPTNGVAVVNPDGTFSYQPNANFNGTDQFTVLVSDGQGGTAVSTVSINVLPLNDPPITSNLNFTINEDTTLVNQIIAVDPDGDPLTFTLQNSPTDGVVSVNPDGTFSYVPNLNFTGTDLFTVQVSDGQGGIAVSTVTITISPINDTPTVPNYTFSTQEDSSLIGAIIATDVDGNPLSYQLQNPPTNGVAVVNPDGTFSYQPNANFNGTDQFTVLVSDGQGGTAVSTVSINVLPLNDPPITADLAFTINEDTTLTNQIPAFDPDGDPLTFTLLNPPPANGSVVLGADGVFTYTPNLNYYGMDTFGVLVSDGQGGTSLSTVTLTIVPVNDPPVGGDRAVTTTINLPVTSSIPASDPDNITLTYILQQSPANGSAIISQDGTFTYSPNTGFIGNDQFTILITDLEGATALSNIFVTVLQTNGSTTTQDLQISTNEDTPVTNQVIATNVNGNPLIYTIENAPINGIVTIDPNTGVFTYTPNANFYGSDAFVVYITDNLGGNATSSVVVTVLPTNDPPIVPNYQLTTNEDTAVTSMVIATDVDNSQLVYSLQNSPANGTVNVGLDGMYTYTPNANFNGTDQFTVLVSDGQGGTAVSTITITVIPVNDPPIGPDIVTVTTNEDTTVAGQTPAFDPDGDSLSFTLQDLPRNGTAVVNADGTFTYTPNSNYTGSDSFSVLISDPSGSFIVTDVFIAIVPVNDPPVVPSYTFTINEDTVLNSLVAASDIDGDSLIYALSAPPTNGTVVVNPDGTYTYTPNENYNGTDSFSVVVSDGQGGTAVSTITITILPVNDPPVGPVVVTLVTNEDTPVSSQITAVDPDGEVLTYTLQDPPTNGVAVVNADGTFTYTPNGNYNGPDTFTVLISDPSGAFIVTSVFVTVTPVNDVPVVPNYEFVINEDTTLNSQVVATDIDGNPLTYALLTGPVNGTVVVNSDGTYTYTPNENYNGVDSFSVVVSDGQGGTAVSTITITILPVNDPPVGPVVVTLVTDEDTPVSSQITAFDPDGEVLTYTLQDPPTNGVAAVNADGAFTYTPNGNYNGPDTFTLLISDPSGAFIVTSVFVTVTPVNDVPVVPNYEFVINEDTTLNSQVVATDIDGNPLTYALLTGPVNGTVVVNPDGTYTYTPNENYNGVDSFSVVVSDGQGGTAVSTITITILPVNDPPVGPVVVTLVTNEDTPVSSQITAVDPDGEVLTYTLQDPPTNGVAVVNADGAFTYTPNGNYNGPDTFTVLISDPSGAFIVTSVFVTVTPVNDVPVVPNYEFVINEDTTLNSQVVATDIDGNPLTYALLTGPVNGTVVVNPDGTYTYTPNENYNGVDSFSVVVSDGQGGTAVSTITITILPVNDPPVGPVVVTLVTNEDTPVSSQITAVDPDGEVLTYTLQDPPTNGVAVVNADGTFTYTPNGNYNGPDTFTVLISDPSGAFIVTSVFVTVTPVNDVPVVPNYEFVINEDTTLNSQVVATDIDGNPLTYALLTGPVNGTVVVNSDGTYTYTPNENYNGVDSFSVVVSDGQGGTAVSTITITILPVNNPPVGPVVVTLVTNEDTPVSSQITAVDPDGEVLTYTLQDPPTNGVAVVNADGTFTYTPNGNYNGPDTFTVLISDPSGAFIVTSVFVTVTPVNDVPVVPNYEFVINEDTTLNSQVVATDIDGNPLTYALLTGSVNGTVVVNPDGTFTYTPNENYNGIDSFSVVVSDGQGGTAVSTITITILPVNDPPVGPVVVTLVTNEDTPVSSQITAVDPDGEVLTYTLQDPPTNGVAVVDADGTFTYTPNGSYNGPDTFTVLISDPSGAFIVTSVFVTVTPVNDVPVVPNYEFVINEDTTLNSQVVATDIDGNPLTYALLTGPVNGTIVVNPDGTYTYTPNENYNGVDSFSVVVSDGQGGTAVSTITITILPVNDSPVGPDVITVTTLEEIPITGQIVATDPDGDPLIYTLQDLPTNGIAIINQEGLFTYIPNENFAGNDTFTVLIADSTGQFIITNVFVVVIPVEQPPTVPNYSITTPENQSVTSQVVGTDPNGDPLTYRLGTSPVNGSVIVNADGSFVYLPNSNYVGLDLFTVIVEDSTGLTAVSIVNVTVIDMNDSPVTSDVILQTIENVAINGRVFATDPDDNLLTFSLSGTPFNGTAVVNADGTFLYTPNLNFIGLDSFTVEVRDSRGASAQSLVTISVIRVNQPPLVIDLSISTLQGQFVTGQIPAFDPEGDPLVYGLSLAPLNGTAIINADGTFTYTPNPSFVGTDSFSVFARDTLGNQGFGTITVEVQSQDLPISAEGLTLTTLANQPVSGSIATVNPAGFPLSYAVAISPSNGTVVLNQDGTLVYTPNPGFTGEDVFDIVVRDSSGNQSIANAVVTVVVGDRISVVNSEITTLFNVPVSGKVSATNLSGNQLFYTLTSNPINGSVLVNPDGTFSYTPNAGFFGTDQFQVLVSDVLGNTAVATVSIVTEGPVERAPIVSDQTLTTIEEQPVSGAVQAVDPQGETLTYTLLGTPPNGIVVLNPDGTFTYTPNSGFVGTESFTVAVQNQTGLNATATIQVTVNPLVNQIIVTNTTVRTEENQSVNDQVSARDQLNRPLTYTLNTPPLYGTAIVNQDGTFIYTPTPGVSGIDQFDVLIQNDQGDQAIAPVIVIINPAQSTITPEDVTVQTQQNMSVSGTIIATDSLGRPLRYSLNLSPLNGTVIINPDGTFIYTPNPQFFGIDSFTVLVQNDRGNSAIGIVRVVVQENQDIITVTPLTVRGQANQPVTGQVTAIDTLGRPLTYQVNNLPSNGTIVFNANGTFIYTPNMGFIGIDSFTVLVQNDLGQFATSSVNVVVEGINNTISTQDQELTIPTGQIIESQIIAVDALGRPLTYTVVTPPANGVVVLNTDGTFTYTSNLGFVGQDQFVVVVRNDTGQEAFSVVTVNSTAS
ncbi:tandem-95 repeat protein, partial (plasmid) [Priestia megaterium]|uniref:tandem-95 repeat protein n=1 Tax=Priestia megaterium TaxID=1404 RepID=UPI0039EEF03C